MMARIACNPHLGTGESPKTILKEAVSAFDGYANAYRKQLLTHVDFPHPLKKEFKRKKFHDFEETIKLFKEIYDIDLSVSVQPTTTHMTTMFLRRHVHEHNASHIDKKYLAKSNDSTVVEGQLLRENKDDVSNFIEGLEQMAINLHTQFHEIVHTRQDEPIENERQRRLRMEKYNRGEF